MKRILISVPLLLVALTIPGCALAPVGPGNYVSSDSWVEDTTAQRTQEDVQRMNDWLNQQQAQAMQDQAIQMTNQAALDASNAAAASAAAAAAPLVNP